MCITRKYYFFLPSYSPTPDEVGTFGYILSYRCIFGAFFMLRVLQVKLYVLAICFTMRPHMKPPWNSCIRNCVFSSCPTCCAYSINLKRRVLFGLLLESSRSVALVPSPAAMSITGCGSETQHALAWSCLLSLIFHMIHMHSSWGSPACAFHMPRMFLGSFILETLLTPTFSEKVLCGMNIADPVCVRADSLIQSERGTILK